MRIEFNWNRPVNAITEDRTGGRNGRLFLANEAKRLMDPYVPADNMVLAQNVRTYTEGNAGIIHYTSPYAHYQYKGELYVDPETKKGAFYSPDYGYWSRPGISKVPSDRKLNHSTFRHPLATSEWDKAMKTANRGRLTRAYQRYLGG